jgi:hypothetical protein
LIGPSVIGKNSFVCLNLLQIAFLNHKPTLFGGKSICILFTDMTIGVPIKLLHEAQGHIVTIELKTGSVYRGKLYQGWCRP